MKYTVKKGFHFSLPRNQPVQKFEKVEWVFMITNEFKYVIKDSFQVDGISLDQYDWCKLLGVTTTPFNNMGDTCMAAIRYIPSTDSVEVCPYWHRNTYGIVREMDEDLKIKISLNEDYTVSMLYDGSNLHYICSKNNVVLQSESKIFKKGYSWFNLCNKIQFWFGGNIAAPSDTCVYVTSK